MVSRKWPIGRFIHYVSRLTLYGSAANACIIRKSQRLTALEDWRDRSEKLEPSAFCDDIRFPKKKPHCDVASGASLFLRMCSWPRKARSCTAERPAEKSRQLAEDLFQLGFFVVNVLASNRIKLLDQHLVRCAALIFGGRVEVTGSCGRFQLNFFPNAFGHVLISVMSATAIL